VRLNETAFAMISHLPNLVSLQLTIRVMKELERGKEAD